MPTFCLLLHSFERSLRKLGKRPNSILNLVSVQTERQQQQQQQNEKNKNGEEQNWNSLFCLQETKVHCWLKIVKNCALECLSQPKSDLDQQLCCWFYFVLFLFYKNFSRVCVWASELSGRLYTTTPANRSIQTTVSIHHHHHFRPVIYLLPLLRPFFPFSKTELPKKASGSLGIQSADHRKKWENCISHPWKWFSSLEWWFIAAALAFRILTIFRGRILQLPLQNIFCAYLGPG